MILLDTCALLWLAGDDPALRPSLRARIDAEALVAVSAISAFEVSLKWRAGKLELPLPAGEWWDDVVRHHRIEVLPIDAAVAIRATALPPIHRNPADRFIIATALMRGAPVITTDPRFAEYGVEVPR